jgi:hypothetical protein
LVTLLAVEAGGSKRTVDHSFPNSAEASDDMFVAKKGSSPDALSHLTSLNNMVGMLRVFVSIGCTMNSKGALSVGGANAM